MFKTELNLDCEAEHNCLVLNFADSTFRPWHCFSLKLSVNLWENAI